MVKFDGVKDKPLASTTTPGVLQGFWANAPMLRRALSASIMKVYECFILLKVCITRLNKAQPDLFDAVFNMDEFEVRGPPNSPVPTHHITYHHLQHP